MNRMCVAAVLVVFSGSLAWAQSETPAPAPSGTPVLSEQYFLDRAGESAKSGDLDAAAQFFQSAIIYAGNSTPRTAGASSRNNISAWR
jgi:hypothetical protein